MSAARDVAVQVATKRVRSSGRGRVGRIARQNSGVLDLRIAVESLRRGVEHYEAVVARADLLRHERKAAMSIALSDLNLAKRAIDEVLRREGWRDETVEGGGE